MSCRRRQFKLVHRTPLLAVRDRIRSEKMSLPSVSPVDETTVLDALYCCGSALYNGCEEYCASCHIPLCGDCKRNAFHSTHFHVSLDAAYKSMSKELGEGKERIKPVVESRRNLNRMKNFLAQQHQAARDRIQHSFAAWRDALDLREAELLADLDSMCEKDLTYMDQQVKSYESALTPMEWEMLHVEEADNKVKDEEREREQAEKQLAMNKGAVNLSSTTNLSSTLTKTTTASAPRGKQSDVNAPWWFRLAPILMGRRKLKHAKQKWDPTPLPPAPHLSLCFAIANEPTLPDFNRFGQVYTSPVCAPLTKVTSELFLYDNKCLHGDKIEIKLHTVDAQGNKLTKGGAQWQAEFTVQESKQHLIQYILVKEPAPAITFNDLGDGTYIVTFSAAFGAWTLRIWSQEYQLPLIDFECSFPNGRFVRSLGREGVDIGELYEPFGLALDSAKQLLFVADKENHRVQCWNTRDGECVLNIDAYQLNRPLTEDEVKEIYDQQMKVYYAHLEEFEKHQQQQLQLPLHLQNNTLSAPVEPVILDPAQTVPPQKIIMTQPHSVCMDDERKRLFIADTFNHRILVISLPDGRFIREIGEEGSGKGEFKYPGGVAYWQNKIFVSDSNHSVQVFNVDDGSFIRTFGSRGDAPGRFNTPFFMTVWDSKLYVGEYYNHRISVFDLNTYMPIFLLGREGTGQTEFRRVTGVAVDPNTQLLYVGDSFNHRVSVFSAVDGSWFGSIGHEGKGKGEFHHVRDIAVDADAGLLYVSDWGNNRIQVFGVFQRPRIPRSADDDDQDI